MTDGCNFWSWHTDDYICNLKDSDGAGLEEHDNRISGARGCPEDGKVELQNICRKDYNTFAIFSQRIRSVALLSIHATPNRIAAQEIGA